MQPTWKYVTPCRSMKPLCTVDKRRKFTSPEARAHEQDYSEHFDTGCMYMGSQIANCLF